MKRILILLLALMQLSCINKTTEKAVMTVIDGERDTYGILSSEVYLPTQDTTKFEVKVYQGEEGLMLESPKILVGNLFGIRGTEFNTRLKYSFTFQGKEEDSYIYTIPYHEFPAYEGAYIFETFDYCWIYYQFDDMSNTTNMVEFSKAEFEQLFDVVKAYIVNY